KTLSALKFNPDILYAGLCNTQQQILGTYRQENYLDKPTFQNNELKQVPHLQQTKNFVQITHPVYLNGELLGYLVLNANFSSLDKKLHEYVIIILTAFLITLMMALYLSSYLQRIVLSPIVHFADFIHQVAKSKIYSVQAAKESDDEIGHLVDAFNDMMAELNLSFQKRSEVEQTLSHHLNHLQEIVDEQTLDLQHSVKIADAANRSKSEFLANMSHEIRTPMNAIMGMTYLVQRTELTNQQRNYVDKINAATQALLNIINDILDFSKIEAGKLTLENTAFSLDKMLANLLDLLKIKAEQKNIQLSFVVSPNTPRQLLGDALRLGQILINLISNAVKFTEQGGVILYVESEAVLENMVELHFSVKDTGIGMTDEHIEKLFQPFAQADNSITRQYGGTGLGLTICRQLAQLMGGEISVSSVLGVGSTFTFKIPLALACPLTTCQFTTCQLAQVNGDNVTYDELLPNYNYTTQRILLVEDNEINQQVAMELLTSMGLHVDLANNGKEGVARALAEPFDLILMDIQMPVMDGLTATQHIRAVESLANLPIVAMTAHAMQGDRDKSLAAGMNDHITKPIELEKLITTLNRWLKMDSYKLSTAAATLPDDLQFNLLPITLPPFDLVQALKFSNQSAALLHRLLLNFRSHYANSANELTYLIDMQDFTSAGQLIHSLKGVAGTLAANELGYAASELEIALYTQQIEDLTPLLRNLTKTLTTAIEAAMTLPLLPEQNNNLGEKLDTGVLQKLLKQLHAALASNHFNATEIFDQLKPHLLSLNLHKEVAMLTNHLEQLDFQQALPVLVHIHELLIDGKTT
ncbi:MAG: ATP-binding protein, partial [Methylococcales bacterium]|nr:ATP-binding protein [Methylococcales bacterium]